LEWYAESGKIVSIDNYRGWCGVSRLIRDCAATFVVTGIAKSVTEEGESYRVLGEGRSNHEGYG
jgi:hypothetical protein